MSIAELAKALVAVQHTIPHAKKDSTNPHFKSKYADLASIWDAVRDALHMNGLAVIQTIEVHEKTLEPVLVTQLLHVSGEFVTSHCPIIMEKKTPQAMGSAITYARRYALAAIIGVVADDDDGEAAMDRGGPAKRSTESSRVDRSSEPSREVLDMRGKILAAYKLLAPGQPGYDASYNEQVNLWVTSLTIDQLRAEVNGL